jgi:hypothetical protein
MRGMRKLPVVPIRRGLSVRNFGNLLDIFPKSEA